MAYNASGATLAPLASHNQNPKLELSLTMNHQMQSRPTANVTRPKYREVSTLAGSYWLSAADDCGQCGDTGCPQCEAEYAALDDDCPDEIAFELLDVMPDWIDNPPKWKPLESDDLTPYRDLSLFTE